MDQIKLYSYFRSSAAYRVRIALNLKGLKYETIPVHLLSNGGEQNQSPYAAVNPMKQVPSLIHKGKTLGQSVAIIEYLDQIFPTPQLYPSDPYLAARVRQVCEIVNSGIHPILNLKLTQELEKRFQMDEQQKAEWMTFWMENGFQAIEKIIFETAKTYSFGDQVTAAELFLVPQIFNARRFKVEMSKFPLLSKIDENCKILLPFIDAHPMKQPDTPADLK
jgi:maleylacetoacetate isomerase